MVTNVEVAIAVLYSIAEIGINPDLERDVQEYVARSVYYPKNSKIRPRVYFIIIKTEAGPMLDFKQKKALRSNLHPGDQRDDITPVLAKLTEERPGRYEGTLDFTRVVLVPVTGKHEYRDTHFGVNCKARSRLDCYNRMGEHLRGRVDSRRQFPSAKGKNFHFKYLGMWK